MKKIMIAGFWALLLIPNLLFPFVKGSSQTGTGENRNLAEFPVFSPDTYLSLIHISEPTRRS